MRIQNRDFVIIGLQQWYTPIGSNCKNIARQLAKDNRVLYVNSPLDRRTILHAKEDPNIGYHLQATRGEKEAIVPIGDNMWNLYPPTTVESINWIPFTPVFSWFNRRNNRKFAADIKAAADQLGFRDLIVFNDNDMFRGFYMKEYLQPKTYIYYSRDYLLGVDYWKKHGTTLEPQHIAKADVAVANSLYLADMLKQYNTNSHYVGQGCDFSLFNAAEDHPVPADLAAISGTRIGYVGALNSIRLDIGILEQMGDARPDWQIVLVGPEDDTFRSSRLHSMPNVHFLGRKELPELAAYIRHFDVCLNPQLVNPVTIGNYPLKIDEYLAMGKPVVATATQTMSLFRDHVYLAQQPGDYVALTEKALAENTPAVARQRMDFARSHTWENSVDAIYNAILSKGL
ncbi:glycosyltransferase family 1 protein [Chitinophaga lutea]|uniref:Glycosyltransferase family 1 protein n=1 Tax=Chitinophaga lutea TaxID=2488634 RepID=A0A3N4PI40_9BACT|nr:glycosyltransferase [Chitinophaga lutea]RPE08352.1 glycosyltransferase family 1 protein [Chitinophaga lutea]